MANPTIVLQSHTNSYEQQQQQQQQQQVKKSKQSDALPPTIHATTGEPSPLSTSPQSITSLMKGRSLVLRSWLITNPLVTSVFDDMDKGLAKQTRINTLHNRKSSSDLTKYDNPNPNPNNSKPFNSLRKNPSAPNLIGKLNSSCKTLHHSSSSSSLCTGNISFAGKVHAYYYSGDEQNSNSNDDNDSNSSVVEEPLKPPTNKLPLEVRRNRARMQYPTDPSQPLTNAGKWVKNHRSS